MDSEISDFAILDSLNEEIAVLDESGIIVHINHTWGQSIHNMDRNLIRENIIGINYLDVCRNSYLNSNDTIAKKVLDGLEKIYNLEINNFSMEYPCLSYSKNSTMVSFASSPDSKYKTNYPITYRYNRTNTCYVKRKREN